MSHNFYKIYCENDDELFKAELAFECQLYEVWFEKIERNEDKKIIITIGTKASKELIIESLKRHKVNFTM